LGIPWANFSPFSQARLIVSRPEAGEKTVIMESVWGRKQEFHPFLDRIQKPRAMARNAY
jgi:hypothetical protein